MLDVHIDQILIITIDGQNGLDNIISIYYCEKLNIHYTTGKI